MTKVLVVCLSPAFESILVFDHIRQNEVNRCHGHYLFSSGKGLNVARQLSSLNVGCTCLTSLGGPRVQEFTDLSQGFELVNVPNDDGGIRTCTTLMDSTSCTELVEEAYDGSHALSLRIIKAYEDLLESSALVVITGSKPRGFDEDLYGKMCCLARDKPMILDIRGKDLLGCLEHRPLLIKPNLSEFAQTFLNLDVRESLDNLDIRDIVVHKQRELYEEHGISSLISRGAFSSWLYTRNGFFEIQVPKIESRNTIGCGDALTAMLAKNILEGRDLLHGAGQAVEFASSKALGLFGGVC